MTPDNDSPDLEALFDSVAASVQSPVAPPPPPAPKPAAPSGVTNLGDSDDLQALFDSVAAECRSAEPAAEPAAAAPAGGEWPAQESVFNRIGQMARQLHDTLHELGYDKLLENTVSALPDAKDRLAYVANLTEQAACRVLNATDIAKPVVDDLENRAKELGGRWDRVFANQMSTAEFKKLAEETRSYLNVGVSGATDQVNAQLMEIMMAQDFQDLTGQVIKKIVSLAQDLENGLMTVLIEVVPQKKRSQEVDNLMNGPVISADGRSDVVVNQQQVDDLLDSLGF
ncbi:protein phosphatase CheZ [Azovibrio restrictus]|uniref:protein phosphatase CheZ n=1 Tax=Azovibrio restrictus TaxID=146938 RepID=UPI00041E2370|nr:protein phosphatase CheZ [Azovibrio restrictus]